jgi:hypothetical protein
MARSSECTDQYARKVLDTADIVRDAIFHQPTSNFLITPFFLLQDSSAAEAIRSYNRSNGLALDWLFAI